MGIFSDVGRFFKAREFKKYMESEGGAWMAFGIGSENWDYFVKDKTNNSVMNIPVATPRSSSSMKEWIAKDRGILDVSQLILNPNERIFLDTSYIKENETIPDYEQIPNRLDQKDIPRKLYLTESSTTADFTTIDYDNIEVETDEQKIKSIKNPTFPQCYIRDFKGDNGEWLIDFNVDRKTKPSDHTLYHRWAKSILVKDSITNKNPLGFLSLVKADVQFVKLADESVNKSDESVNNMNIFMYGSHKWKTINDEEAEKINAHHILITCTVFPRDLHDDEIVESEMNVRQVQVYHLNKIEGLTHSGDTKLGKDEIPNSVRNINCYFKSLETTFPEGSIVINDNKIELLINDFMSQRIRKVNQSDRYGFIIGF